MKAYNLMIELVKLERENGNDLNRVQREFEAIGIKPKEPEKKKN